MARSSQPSPPSNLKRQGRSLWRKVTGTYELEDHELVLLAQACHTLDVIDQLETAIANDGVTAEGSRGQMTTHPAVNEIRLQRVTFARLLAALALPDSEGGRTVATGHQSRSRAGHATRWANVRALRNDNGA